MFRPDPDTTILKYDSRSDKNTRIPIRRPLRHSPRNIVYRRVADPGIIRNDLREKKTRIRIRIIPNFDNTVS